MTRLRHDVDFLTTVALLVTVVATALTGVIADLWDLNDFWYHTVAGYAMGVFAAAHVWLNRERLVGYARFRWRSLTEPRLAATRPRPASAMAGAAAVGDRAGPSRLGYRSRTHLAAGTVRADRRRRRRHRPRPRAAAGTADRGRGRRRGHLPPVEQARHHRRARLRRELGPAGRTLQALPGGRHRRRCRRRDLEGGLAAAEAIARRRSTRDYVATPMTPSRAVAPPLPDRRHRHRQVRQRPTDCARHPGRCTRSRSMRSSTASTASNPASITTLIRSMASSGCARATIGPESSSRASPRSSSGSAASSCSSR